MKKKINNYRFQQQQQAKQEYQKVKKIKEKTKKIPENATEEIEYIKKLLSGEDVDDFGHEEPKLVETDEFLYWSTTKSVSYHSGVSSLSLSELLSIGSITKGKRL